MERIEKNRKQRFTSLPVSISWVFRIVLAVAGFYLWGSDFLRVLLGLYIGFSIIRRVLSCLVSLVILVILAALLLLLATIMFSS